MPDARIGFLKGDETILLTLAIFIVHFYVVKELN